MAELTRPSTIDAMSDLEVDPVFTTTGDTRSADGVLALLTTMLGHPMVDDAERRRVLSNYLSLNPGSIPGDVINELASRGLVAGSA